MYISYYIPLSIRLCYQNNSIAHLKFISSEKEFNWNTYSFFSIQPIGHTQELF